MKKIFVFIILCLFTFVFISCKDNTDKTDTPPIVDKTEENGNPSTDESGNQSGDENGNDQNNDNGSKTEEMENYLSGTAAVKILLAQKRLKAEKLDNSVGIFNGKQVFENLVTKIRLNKKNKEHTYVDDVIITNNTVEWLNSDKNYSNNMAYFENLTGNVESSAERGAQMIKNVKSYIRVVNCWVKVNGENILLLVDEHSETIFVESQSSIDICRRYTNEDGKEVYELYYNNEVGRSRMKYIENMLVEYFHKNHTTDFEHHFTADNSKGYWDVFGDLYGDSYNATVIKDEIVYDYISNYGVEKPSILDIVSNDRLNDVMSITDYSFELSAHAFDGIEKFVVDIESKDDIVTYEERKDDTLVFNHGGFYYSSNFDKIKMVLDNGNVINYGDEIDNVKFTGVHLSADHGLKVYFQTVNFVIKGETIEEKYNHFKKFLDDNGIVCKYDLDKIFQNALLAYEEIKSEAKYRIWNGVVVNNFENSETALKLEISKFDYFEELIELTKELEVIDFEDQDVINSKIDFVKVKSYEQENVKYIDNSITIEDLKLTIEKSPLLDKLETYSLKFGLISTANQFNEILLDIELEKHPYNNEDEYQLEYSGSFNIPSAGIGDYLLGAYISTSEGLRISEIQYVVIDEFVEYSTKTVDHIITVSKTEDSYLYMKVEKNPDIYLSNEFIDYVSYEELLLYMGSNANEFGMVEEEAYIEVLNISEEYVKLETSISSGNYRLMYKYYSTEGYKDAYVYADIVVDFIEFQHTTTSVTLEELIVLFNEKVTLPEEFYIEVFEKETSSFVSLPDDYEFVTGLYRVNYYLSLDQATHIYLELTIEETNDDTEQNQEDSLGNNE